MRVKHFILILFLLSIIVQSIHAQTTTLVSLGLDGKLIYKPDAVGSVIPDFSGVGYKNSEKPIPNVAVVKTVTAVAGDNTSNIQTAINQVAAMPLQEDGFRGAILFKAGLYEIAERINITASGIVLRGEGLSTVFKATGTTQCDLIRISGGSVSVQTASQKKITDAFVPIGAKTITVENGHTFTEGDWVYVRREPNAAWITLLGMDKLERTSHPDVVNWTTLQYYINIPDDAEFGSDYKLHISWSSSAGSKPICDFHIDDIVLTSTIPTSTSVAAMRLSERFVFASRGKINFISAENIPYTVYNINGNKVVAGLADSGASIALHPGVYIVKMKNLIQKVVL